MIALVTALLLSLVSVLGGTVPKETPRMAATIEVWITNEVRSMATKRSRSTSPITRESQPLSTAQVRLEDLLAAAKGKCASLSDGIYFVRLTEGQLEDPKDGKSGTATSQQFAAIQEANTRHSSRPLVGFRVHVHQRRDDWVDDDGTYHLGCGDTPSVKGFPVYGEHEVLRELRKLHTMMNGCARESGEEWMVATAHILAAVKRSLESNDTSALDEPHKWARRFIQKTEGSSLDYIPSEKTNGAFVGGIVQGFDIFSGQISQWLAAHKRGVHISISKEHYQLSSGTLHQFAVEQLAEVMLQVFTGVSSLVATRRQPIGAEANLMERVVDEILMRDGDWSSGYDPDRVQATVGRIEPFLRSRWKEWVAGDHQENAAFIAEHLLRRELEDSGWTEQEIQSELHFLEQRRSKSAKGTLLPTVK